MSNWLNLGLRTSPHLARGLKVDAVMRHVILALVPAALLGIYAFGLSALLLMITCALACMLTETFVNSRQGKANTLGDGSAVLTGLLLAMTLPPAFPLWMAVIGCVVAVGLGKGLFGGLGHNVFNPALVGRAFLQAAFPAAITAWSNPLRPDRFVMPSGSTLGLPFTRSAPDVFTGATPLSAMKFDHVATAPADLFTGLIPGSMGETGAVLILLGGLYLAWRGLLDWRIPVSILASVALLSGVLNLLDPASPTPLFMLGAGGLMLGAVFMATDMVTSPVTPLGTWLYGALIGLLVVVIRIWGGLPEGVMYAILLGNTVTPLLNRYTQPRIYGQGKAA
jgi:electron transport complex protein RnfD